MSGTPACSPTAISRREAQSTEPTPMAGKTPSSARRIDRGNFAASTSPEAAAIPGEELPRFSSPPKSRRTWSFATAVRIALGAAYAVLWIGGVYTHCLTRASAEPPWAAPLFLLLAALIATLACGEVAVPAIYAAGGFLAEVVGVHTGFPFGEYVYSSAFGPSVAGVPLAIACAWVVLLLFARDLAGRFARRRWAAVVVGAAMMTMFDLLVDPVATSTLSYWKWRLPGPFFGVPLSNFAGWFGVSALLLAIAPPSRRNSRAVVVLGSSVILFFSLIAAFGSSLQ